MLLLLLSWPSRVAHVDFVSLPTGLSIKVQIKTPARIALEFLTAAETEGSIETPGQIDLNKVMDKKSNPSRDLYVLPALKLSLLEPEVAPVEVPARMVSNPTINVIKKEPLVFSGPLELAGGTTLGPGRHLEVQWKGFGKERALGKVDVTWDKAKYHIEAPYAGGEIIAQVVEASGEVVGEGRLNLGSSDALTYVAGEALKIEPRNNRIYTPNFYDQVAGKQPELANDSQVEVAGAHYSADGLHAEPRLRNLRRGSRTLAKASSEGFVDTLSIVGTEGDHKLPLFPHNFSRALYDIVLGLTNKTELKSLVIGRVKSQEQGQAGIRVQVETPFPHEVFYLNELFLPDPSLKGTTPHGYFIVADLPLGLYSFKGMGLGQIMGVTHIAIASNSVSYGELELLSAVGRRQFEVYDAFDAGPAVAKVYHQHSSDPIYVSGRGWADTLLPKSQSEFFVVTPQDSQYLIATYMTTPGAKSISIPLISSDWVQRLLLLHRVNYAQGDGAVIGFFDQDPGVVTLELQKANYEVIYFDARGVRAPQPAVGGGFIVFGVTPDSLQLLSIEYLDNTKFTQIISVSPHEYIVIGPNF